MVKKAYCLLNWEQVDATRTFYKREIVEMKPYIMDILGIEENFLTILIKYCKHL